MGIDLIEQSEMSALAPSRMGNKCFVDDNSYSNFSFRGHKYFEKKRSVTQASSIAPRYEVDPTKEKDCSYLQSQLTDIQNNIEAELGSNPSKSRLSEVVGAYRVEESKYKTLLANNNCAEIKSAAENKQAQADILSAISGASSDTPQVGATTSKNKYLYWGIGGVVAIAIISVVIKTLKK